MEDMVLMGGEMLIQSGTVSSPETTRGSTRGAVCSTDPESAVMNPKKETVQRYEKKKNVTDCETHLQPLHFFQLQQRKRKRHSSDQSDDEDDGDFPEQDCKMEEEESNTIMLRGLPPCVTEEDVSIIMQRAGHLY